MFYKSPPQTQNPGSPQGRVDQVISLQGAHIEINPPKESFNNFSENMSSSFSHFRTDWDNGDEFWSFKNKYVRFYTFQLLGYMPYGI